jgi:ArsR family transcriptional regulator
MDLKKLSSLFKVLSDPNRIKLLDHLCSCREANVGELSRCCSIDLSVVSRHLSKLKNVGVLRARKKGKEVFYDLKAKELVLILRELADEIEQTHSCCKK